MRVSISKLAHDGSSKIKWINDFPIRKTYSNKRGLLNWKIKEGSQNVFLSKERVPRWNNGEGENKRHSDTNKKEHGTCDVEFVWRKKKQTFFSKKILQ